MNLTSCISVLLREDFQIGAHKNAVNCNLTQICLDGKVQIEIFFAENRLLHVFVEIIVACCQISPSFLCSCSLFRFNYSPCLSRVWQMIIFKNHTRLSRAQRLAAE